MKILANDGMPAKTKEMLREANIEVDVNHYEKEELINRIKAYDILVVRSATKVDADLIDAMEFGKTKLIIRAGVGLDNIDVEYARNKRIQVSNTPNSSSNAVAELVLGQMITIARFMHQANVSMRNGEWNKKEYTGVEIFGKTVGIIGFGRIGQAVAQKASALGMDVVFYDRYPINISGYKSVQIEELLTCSDFITIHTTATDTPLIGESEIEIMKNGAFLINAARGNVVDENALILALDMGKLGGAAIDVFTNEPHPNPKICNHPKVSVTPHIGAATMEAQDRIGDEIYRLVVDFEEGFNGCHKAV
ncbi:MAG: 3-phosphoglycerate dehydrogenase [Tissierellia bacterium]|nr:3-phosphoglycerate dehydrogenase [Tissierellia bacterium]